MCCSAVDCWLAPAGPLSAEALRPLRVRNVSSQYLWLTAIPNLRKQCFIYSRAAEGGYAQVMCHAMTSSNCDKALCLTVAAAGDCLVL
jgi:hypothetical protein